MEKLRKAKIDIRITVMRLYMVVVVLKTKL